MVSSWYLRGKTELVVYCQPTPSGRLASKIKQSISKVANNGAKTLVVEDEGKPLVGFLKQTDLFRKSECRFGDENCMIESSKYCTKISVVYEITCNTCKDPVDP